VLLDPMEMLIKCCVSQQDKMRAERHRGVDVP